MSLDDFEAIENMDLAIFSSSDLSVIVGELFVISAAYIQLFEFAYQKHARAIDALSDLSNEITAREFENFEDGDAWVTTCKYRDFGFKVMMLRSKFFVVRIYEAPGYHDTPSIEDGIVVSTRGETPRVSCFENYDAPMSFLMEIEMLDNFYADDGISPRILELVRDAWRDVAFAASYEIGGQPFGNADGADAVSVCGQLVPAVRLGSAMQVSDDLRSFRERDGALHENTPLMPALEPDGITHGVWFDALARGWSNEKIVDLGYLKFADDHALGVCERICEAVLDTARMVSCESSGQFMAHTDGDKFGRPTIVVGLGGMGVRVSSDVLHRLRDRGGALHENTAQAPALEPDGNARDAWFDVVFGADGLRNERLVELPAYLDFSGDGSAAGSCKLPGGIAIDAAWMPPHESGGQFSAHADDASAVSKCGRAVRTGRLGSDVWFGDILQSLREGSRALGKNVEQVPALQPHSRARDVWPFGSEAAGLLHGGFVDPTDLDFSGDGSAAGSYKLPGGIAIDAAWMPPSESGDRLS